MRVSIKVILDKRSKSKKGHPLKLRVHHSGGYDYISLKMYLDVDTYDKIKTEKRLSEELELINQELVQSEARANQIINKMDEFSFQDFKSLFTGKKLTLKKNDSIYSLFEFRISEFKESGKLKSANTYECAIKALSNFKTNVKIKQIDGKFLKAFQNHLTANGKSITTVSIYMRNLRAIINANRDLIDKYPFESYKIPSAHNNKRAVQEDDLQRILSYQFTKEADKFYLDIFRFSYFGGGPNIIDISLLKKENIQGNYLVYSRAKTKKPVKVFILPQAMEIIKKYSSLSDRYLFPMIKSEEPEYLYQRTHAFVKRINSRLKLICEELKIPKITTISARHSFATVLMNKGASVPFISSSLGHTSIATTQNYLGSFSDQQMKDSMMKLL